MENTIINLPQNINIIVWIKKENNNNLNIFLYNENKNYKLNVDKKNFKIDTNSNSLILKQKNLFNGSNKIMNLFLKFFKSWNLFIFKKIKFKGKGFRMRFFKKNKFIKFFFGKSHKTFILFRKILMKRINKYKFILKGLNIQNLNKNSYYAVKIRPLNVYTLRGLRESKQIVYKRKGKKGTYI